MATLNDMMTFDRVIYVGPDGTINTNVVGYDDPEVSVPADDEGQILKSDEEIMQERVNYTGWTLLSGWSGQYSYSGPIMHPSEFIGGGLERHIRETPGYYAAVIVYVDGEEDPAGWAVVYRED